MKLAPTALGNFIAVIANAHKDQLDKGNNPYILHLIRVMLRLRTEDHELMMIAIGHDGLEDGVVTIEQLIAAGATPRVIAGLKLLNHDPAEPYQEYVERLCQNYDTIRVKIEDVRDNSDITRTKPYDGNSEEERIVHEQKQIKRIRKYQIAYKTLIEARKRFEILSGA